MPTVFGPIGKYTPEQRGVRGERGWVLPFYRQWLSISRFRCCLAQISEDRLQMKIILNELIYKISEAHGPLTLMLLLVNLANTK